MVYKTKIEDDVSTSANQCWRKRGTAKYCYTKLCGQMKPILNWMEQSIGTTVSIMQLKTPISLMKSNLTSLELLSGQVFVQKELLAHIFSTELWIRSFILICWKIMSFQHWEAFIKVKTSFSARRCPPPHYANFVRDLFNEQFPNRWIGRRGSVEWPARSPGLTPMDLFFWGVVNDSVFEKKPTTVNEMMNLVREACDAIDTDKELCRRVCRSVESRLQQCADKEGDHFEHLRK